MSYYRWTGTNPSGEQRGPHVMQVPTKAELLQVVTDLLDAGWTRVSVSDGGGTEVAGIQDFGGGHHEAWVTS